LFKSKGFFATFGESYISFSIHLDKFNVSFLFQSREHSLGLILQSCEGTTLTEELKYVWCDGRNGYHTSRANSDEHRIAYITLLLFLPRVSFNDSHLSIIPYVGIKISTL